MKYAIGIDGGGTKTAFLLTDENGGSVAALTLGRSNPADIGCDNAIAILRDGIKTLLSDSGIKPDALGAVFAGISGVCSNDGYIGAITSGLSSALPGAAVQVDSDGHNLLYAAFPDSDGAAVICGTGSSCFVKVGESISRIGGYGPVDGCGNGFEIGKAAINHACRALDGRDFPSALSDAVLKKHGERLIENIGALISGGKSALAAYAPLVFDCYETDSYARAILDANIAYLAELITAAGRFFTGSYAVSLTGGIGSDPLTLRLLAPLLSPRVELSVLSAKPVSGAAARARRLLRTAN